MWYYGGMDVPFVDPTLVHNHGLGTWNYGLTTPFFGTPRLTWGDVNFDGRIEVLPLGGLPYGTPQMGFTPYRNSFINPLYNTVNTPFFGYNNMLPNLWGTPTGLNTLGLMGTNWGINPWFAGTPIGYSPIVEPWRSTFGWTTPITQSLPFSNSLGIFGNSYGINSYNPFLFTGIEDRIRFQTPFTSGLGLFNSVNTFHTPYVNTFNTPIDWKVKTFGTPVGMNTETWSKPVGFPWKSNVISGPVAVL